MKQIRVCVDVDDLERAISFYRVLGLTPGRRLGKHWVEMLGAQAPIDLLGTPEGTTALPTSPVVKRDFSRHWTPVHLDLIVDGLDTVLENALAAGATLDPLTGSSHPPWVSAAAASRGKVRDGLLSAA